MSRKANLVLFFLLSLIHLSQAQDTFTGSHSNKWNNNLIPEGTALSVDGITSNKSNTLATFVTDKNPNNSIKQKGIDL